MTVNICMWVESVIAEISNSMELRGQVDNETLVVKTEQTVRAAAYFLPGTAEYCAIAAVNIYEMLQRVGQFKQIEADHELVVLVQDRLFSFILLHLMTVNICMWVESVIAEISNSMELRGQVDNETLVVKTEQTVRAAAYFLPGTAEYCAIAAVNIYEMLQRVGQFKQIEADHEVSDNVF
ncbi:hypothetical protein AHF37_01858 [Paragonimus kellicotti]|nr:hypothetical protein AHF37_01858 [Paragonimus kellicotti]